MKRFLFMIGGLFWILSLNSQTLSPHVVAASGQSFSSPGKQIDFTIGEIVISSLTSSDKTLTQGFHQPKILITGVEDPDDEFVFSLYPNPADRFVIIESTQETEMQVHVYDIMGKVLQVSSLFTKKITIDLQSLASGHYNMVITNAFGNHLSSYKMIKI